jgi:predicted nucleic acid-binding protein
LPVLCDVNLLLALVTDRHQHHAIAAQWIEKMQSGEVVVCRVVQTGLLRLLNNPAVMGDEALEADDCWSL